MQWLKWLQILARHSPSQRALADELGVPHGTLYCWTRGHRTPNKLAREALTDKMRPILTRLVEAKVIKPPKGL